MSDSATDRPITPLFFDRERTFWTFQVLAWTAYGLARLAQTYTIYGQIQNRIDDTVIAATAGFVLTTIMRLIYQPLGKMPLPVISGIAVLVSSIFAFLFSAIEVTAIRVSDPLGAAQRDLRLFDNFLLDGFILLSWSSIYFATKIYRQLIEQKEATLKASAMAHQSQLAMLRYQLNPHFLFNTLNAISTLVLEKEVGLANDMVSKLSAFLRYSLINQPTEKVTLDSELYALRLYLDIEKVRFEERLRIEFDIAEESRKAMMPSLLLQPMIENSIKYAIAPAEDGGVITIKSEVDGDTLRLRVLDTGPGVEDTNVTPSETGSGVGLANTKARLKELYDGHYRFILINRKPQGLEVRIELPLSLDGVEKPRRGPS